MILITGSNGHLGRLVVDQLVDAVGVSNVVATARSLDKIADMAERGIAVRHLDYDDPSSIAAAMEGIEQVLLISGSEFGKRVEQHGAVIDAAAAAGVAHLAYTSVTGAATSSMMVAPEHKATEELLDAADLVTSCLRHSWYIENYTEHLAPVLENGAIIGAAGDGQVSAATRADYAAADVAVLTDPNLWGQTIELGGTPFTMTEYAAAVSAVTGDTIGYVDMPAEDLRSAYVAAGLPEPMIDFMVDVDLGIKRGELYADPTPLEELVGTLTPLRAAVESAVAQA